MVVHMMYTISDECVAFIFRVTELVRMESVEV